MNQRQIEELLDRHADGLLGAPVTVPGRPPAVRPAELGLSPEQKSLLASLASLAERAQAALVEVEPRPAFVVNLKSRLLGSKRAQTQPDTSGQQRSVWIAGVGGALLLASLGILSYKVARAGMGRVAAGRAGHPEAVKAPPAH